MKKLFQFHKGKILLSQIPEEDIPDGLVIQSPELITKENEYGFAQAWIYKGQTEYEMHPKVKDLKKLMVIVKLWKQL